MSSGQSATGERTTCIVAGGGPAGMVLGLLLARAGVEVTVLEKHADFLRDFRGDTVHPSTQTLLDELGLGEAFAKLPQSHMREVRFPGPDGTPVTIGDFGTLAGKHAHPYIAMVPQWDLLNLLAEAGRAEPTYTLRTCTEVTGVLRERGRITGVRYRTQDGQTGELRAELTVACDGRGSGLRAAAGLRPHEYPSPMDAWWFRLPQQESDERVNALRAYVGTKEFVIRFVREGYFQFAYLAAKGGDEKLRGEGIERFRERLATLMPEYADRLDTIDSMDEVKFLDVRLNRLRKWYTDGLLCIGDAAHAMSPIGGVGINVAVQDAVATARILAGPLLAGRVRRRHMARVQAERWLPMAMIQGLQRVLHKVFVGPTVRGERAGLPTPVITLTSRFPAVRAVPAYLIGIGPRPEHAPEFARRAPTPVP